LLQLALLSEDEEEVGRGQQTKSRQRFTEIELGVRPSHRSQAIDQGQAYPEPSRAIESAGEGEEKNAGHGSDDLIEARHEKENQGGVIGASQEGIDAPGQQIERDGDQGLAQTIATITPAIEATHSIGKSAPATDSQLMTINDA